MENYRFEPDHSYCTGPYYLSGQHCEDCEKIFVSHKPGPQEFKPSSLKKPGPVYYCKGCHSRWLKTNGKLKKKDRAFIKIHCFCAPCFKAKLGKCGKTMDSPSKKRGDGWTHRVSYAGMQ